MGNNIYDASHQWYSRPDDARYESIPALHKAVFNSWRMSQETKVKYDSLKVKLFEDNDLALIGQSEVPCRMTYSAMKQLCTRVGAPYDYISKREPNMAAIDLSYDLMCYAMKNEEKEGKILLYHSPKPDPSVVAFTSEYYVRIFNHTVTEKLDALCRNEPWRLPPARPAREGQKGTRFATKADLLRDSDFNLSVKEGDLIAPAGAYWGQGTPQLFVFLVEPTKAIESKGGRQLHRFLILSNSELGDAKFRVKGGLYDRVCGNHILWDVEDVWEISVRHMGKDVKERTIDEMDMVISKYNNLDLSVESERVVKAQNFILGKDKDSVLTKLFEKKIEGKKILDAAYTIAEMNESAYGAPNTAWAMANGLTELSQSTRFADERYKMDLAASKVIGLAF